VFPAGYPAFSGEVYQSLSSSVGKRAQSDCRNQPIDIQFKVCDTSGTQGDYIPPPSYERRR
jgi:hypothetical protein